MALPPQEWRITRVLPAAGLGVLYGKSGAGKSFLALDMAAAIAEGVPWFGYRVKQAPVVYVALEGEAGIRYRIEAWKIHTGRKLPTGMQFVLEPFGLTIDEHIAGLAAVIPNGAVVFIDTLNRAAPGADENSSKDMGIIIAGATALQDRIGGAVVLIHHSGKDGAKGMRGHSSLPAAADCSICVDRKAGFRSWRLEKAKDGEDGASHPFGLERIILGKDEFGEEITSCAVVPDLGAQSQVIQNTPMAQGKNQSKALEIIRAMFSPSIMHTAGVASQLSPTGKTALPLERVISKVSSSIDCSTDKKNTRAKEALEGLAKRNVVCLKDDLLWLP